MENLLISWSEFLRGKRGRRDVQEFSLELMSNIFQLREDLANHTYTHGGYQVFRINDPKPRIIHKALVRDRLLHHAIQRILYPFFDKYFLPDSFSCRVSKGTHKAINRFRCLFFKVSKNNRKTCWVLKCDIKKFFERVDHNILKNILGRYIPDQNTIGLLNSVIDSFCSKPGKGIPLGNLTSQLFANVYLNELDKFIKYKLQIKNYIRYADDFVIFSCDKNWLVGITEPISNFLNNNLDLELHPGKIFIKTINSGVDFLGWINFSNHRILRTTTKRRVIKNLKNHHSKQTKISYLGLLKHGNTNKLKNLIDTKF